MYVNYYKTVFITLTLLCGIMHRNQTRWSVLESNELGGKWSAVFWGSRNLCHESMEVLHSDLPALLFITGQSMMLKPQIWA